MAITGIGTAGAPLSLRQTVQTYFEKLALDNLEASLYFQQIAKHDEIPANGGLTYNTYRYDKIASSTSTLTEGAVPTEVVLSATTSQVTLAQYGQYVIISDLAINAHRTNTIPDAIKELSYTGAKSIDEVVRTELQSNATFFGANGQASIGAVTASDVADMADVRKMVRDFKADNVRPFSDQDFVGIYHPNVMFDLRSNSSAGEFIDVTKATSDSAYGKLLKGEIGRLWQTRFVETSQVFSDTDGAASATVYRNFMVGGGAICDVELGNMPFNLFVKGLGTAGTADPLNQNATVGYKFTYGALYVGGDAANGRAKLYASSASA